MKADYTARVEKVGRDGRAIPRPDLELRRHVAIKVLPALANTERVFYDFRRG
jgi:hypothetical protein